MQFLHPAWLFGMAALALPIIIHLWNIRQGKVLKVGSIALFQASSQKRSQSFKITDWLLLLVRVLLLILIACLLANPVIVHRTKAAKQKGWVLLPKAQLAAGYIFYKKTIDSLLKGGYELHDFNYDFPKIDTAGLAAKFRQTSVTAGQTAADYWGLLRQLDSRVAADVPVYLFTDAAMKNFKGNRPQTALNLKWHLIHSKDTTEEWIADAWFTRSKGIGVVTGMSDTSGINFNYSSVQPDGEDSRFTVTVNGGRPVIQLAGKGGAVPFDTGSIRIAVYTRNYRTDARYLTAALEAAAQFSGKPVIIRQYTDSQRIPAGTDWLFWLSDSLAPTYLSHNIKNVVFYQSGRQQAVSTILRTNSTYALPSGDEQISLSRMVKSSAPSTDILWSDGFGHPLLAVNTTKSGNQYALYTHFNPAWGNMVWSRAFPRLITELLFNKNIPDLSAHDQRQMALPDLLPVQSAGKHLVTTKTLSVKHLEGYLWLALVILFLTERLLATTHKRQLDG